MVYNINYLINMIIKLSEENEKLKKENTYLKSKIMILENKCD